MPELTRPGLERFHKVAASHVGDDKIPGLVALVAHGDQVHVDALGTTSVGGKPVARDTLYRIASTTKPIMAVATLALVDDGLLELDEPVDRLLPELGDRQVLRAMDGRLDDTVPATRPITVRDLLTFTFGFGMSVDMFTSPHPWPIVTAQAERGLGTIGPPQPEDHLPPDKWIAALGSLPLIAQPGERWLYNTGASVLSVLVARAAGTSLGDFMRLRIFEPLQMRDTAFWTTETDRLVTSYLPTPEGLREYDPPDGQWSKPPVFEDGAGGLLSTVDDLLALARMLLRDGRPVLSAAAVRQMTRDQLTSEQKARGGLGPDFFKHSGWGFCIAVTNDGPTAGSFGWDGGLGTSWLVDPGNDLVVIVLTQRMWESALPPAVHTDLQAAAYAALS